VKRILLFVPAVLVVVFFILVGGFSFIVGGVVGTTKGRSFPAYRITLFVVALIMAASYFLDGGTRIWGDSIRFSFHDSFLINGTNSILATSIVACLFAVIGVRTGACFREGYLGASSNQRLEASGRSEPSHK